MNSFCAMPTPPHATTLWIPPAPGEARLTPEVGPPRRMFERLPTLPESAGLR